MKHETPETIETKFTTGFDAVRFAGYAALFDKIDAGRDLIRPGAFEASLAERKKSGEAIPLLWQHRPDQQIGWIERIGEDERGLRVVARIDNPDSAAARMLKDGKLSGLSFGYRAKASKQVTHADGRQGRELAQVDIFEVSLVHRPMQHGARVHFVN
ncbi:HK97 family phage prohead protease [Croceicoccus gelatinilyticus]|uniref:HK97 family phage prohead protease n=1 Tax=Croceicoccus gelatinilyticus TaxID=2835536 RepID=UPI001BD18246|nr:HK97 family phage prohead protease [Croceicoccus gelatinilyticus]MBS7668224.1 HK97 family phage prohead protease [Croceicoccus gelatinilyticus]